MTLDVKEKPGGRVFAISSGVTVIAAVILLGLGIYAMRKPPTAAPAPVAAEQPAPKVVVQKEYVPVPAAPAAQRPTGVPAELKTVQPVIPEIPEDTSGPWTGSWKIPRKSLPMLEIHKKGESFFGRYGPPDYSDVYEFKDGVERDGKLEFAITTHTQAIVQFRLLLQANGDARCECWMKAQDALAMLNNALKLAKTPAQRYPIIASMDREIKRLGTPVPLGTFRKVVDPK